MKKFFAIVAFAAMTLTASAQWTITPHLGVGYTNLSGLDKADGSGESAFNNGIGATLGVDFMYQPTESFGVSAGVDFRYVESGSVNDCKYKFSTFEIPVLAHYNFSEHFGIFAGPKFNILSEAKASGGKVDIDIKDKTRTTVSIPVGLSYTFNKPWVLSAYYDIPTTSITKDDYEKVNVGNIYLTIGYKFNL